MKSVDSLDIPTFGVDLDIGTATNTIDMFTRYQSFWKSCVIRNTQLSDILQYRTIPNAQLKTVQPNSELPVKGWGSFMQVISGAATPVGTVEFVVAKLKDALKVA